ncbi:Uncharacterised protein [Anaerobiospirillum thomasii]|uniref:hypothetical protein n=1 Tax=Anaerobiospirillum thomasii TaxID=179995 RepID=UPI000D8C8B46|nr:hypothetical protein [Anaerobiospirillum thomasii]SPT71548.1 Uncharacterised protein [Anaerobiospirillum thomasii]
MKGITIKNFIKILGKYNQEALISLTALTPDGNYEEWCLGKGTIKEHDNGAIVSLLTVRLARVTNERILRSTKMACVESLRCTVDEVLDRVKERYDLKVLHDTFGTDSLTDEQAYGFLKTIIEQDIEDLVILLEDLKRLKRD